MSMDVIAKEFGFDDAKEMNRLVASVDLTDKATYDSFLVWRETDGSKEGLLKIIKN